jgi:PIN domain nuclease of toxin-antitoxin system
MNILLDTCEFLWLASDPSQLSSRARQCLLDRDNQLFLSAVSFQEIAIKHSIGKLTLPDDPAKFLPEACERLSLTPLPLFPEAALLLDTLPLHHRDPFDRTLICQAIFHHLVFASSDDQMPPYPITLL